MRLLVENGFASIVYTLSFSEAMYHAEEIVCSELKKAIGEYLAMDKKFKPNYENMFNGKIVYIADVYKEIKYSLALNELLELVINQYKAFSEANNG